jgi:probable rRNA maturation factor
MILLDPDLDPHPTLRTDATTGSAAHDPAATPRSLRLPSARTLARFLSEAQAAVRLKGQVTVLLTTDAAIRRLNAQFRGKNKATDVLSFPAEGIGAEEIAGDLAISVPTALRQAVEQGHSLSIEIKVLILHGLLHLAGYDHEADTGQMALRERLLRARLNLPKGLIERVEAPKAPVLKARGVSRGAKSPKKVAAVAVKGKPVAKKTGSRRLKPKVQVAVAAGRTKPRPSKTAARVKRP